MILSCFCVSAWLSCIGAPLCLENSKDILVNQHSESVNFQFIVQQKEKMNSVYDSSSYLSLPPIEPREPCVLIDYDDESSLCHPRGDHKSAPIAVVPPIKSINRAAPQSVLGNIIQADRHEVYENKRVYRSNWTLGQEIYKTFLSNKYITYSFEYFADIPVEYVVTPENVSPRDKVTYSLELTSKHKMSYSELSSIAAKYTSSFSKEFGIEFKIAIPLSDILGMSTDVSDKTKIQFSQSFKEKMERSISSSSSFEKKIVRTFVYDNSNSDDYVKFVPCLRQKFKVYRIEHNHYEYDEKYWKSGLFDLDENWSYTQKSPIKTNSYFFVPIGGMYFEVSQYKLDSNGLDKNLRPMSVLFQMM